MKLLALCSPGRLASILGVAAILIAAVPGSSSASVKEVPPGSHKVFQFSVVGCPSSQDRGSRCGAGSRLFVNLDARNAYILVTNGVSWDVLDCDARSDNWGEIATDDIGKYGIFVRLLGPHLGSGRIEADTYEDFISGETLRLLGVIDLTRGSGQTKFELSPSAMFDKGLDDVVWSMEGDPALKVAELRVYEMP